MTTLGVSGNRPKVIHLTDAQLQDRLNRNMTDGIKRLDVLKMEWQANNAMYQCVVNDKYRAGAIDARLHGAQLTQGTGNTQEITNMMSLKVSTSMINFHAKLVMSEPTVVAMSLDRSFFGKIREKFVQQYCDNIYYSYDIKPTLDSECWNDLAVKGFCVLYCGWDSSLGDIKELPQDTANTVDEEGNAVEDPPIEMTGDHIFRRQDPNYFIIDTTASRFDNAEWCIGGERVPIDTARWRFENFTDEMLEAARDKGFTVDNDNGDATSDSDDPSYAREVIIWTYFEKHLLRNNMRGAKVHFIYQGKDKVFILERGFLDNDHGKLPFCVMTDLELPGSPYGISRATLAGPMHDRLCRFLNAIENNIESYGKTRVLTASQNNSGIENRNGVTFISYNALTGEKPLYLQPSNITTDVWRFYDLISKEIDQLYSSGEFDRGEINRELSSYAVLTAVERSEAKLVNIFNKKKRFIKRMYTLALSDAQQYVTEEREFSTAGAMSHHAFESFKGIDLKGRVNLTVDFGMYMPIDPAARKAQVYDVVKNNLAQRAGINEKDVISNLLGGDLRPVKELTDVAKDVQKEEIMRLVSGEEAPVQPYHEHFSHIAVLADFMNNIEFEKLEASIKQEVFQHYFTHTQEAAKLQAMAQGGMPGAPGAPGAQPPPEGQPPQPQGAPTATPQGEV
jgi:hypothetical protein